MSSPEYVRRTYADYAIEDLPFDSEHHKVTLQDISRLRVKLSHRKTPIDIGCWAYGNRRKIVGKSFDVPVEVLVDGSTLRKDRFQAIFRLAEEVFVSRRLGSLRPKTIEAELSALGRFVDWCDENNHYSAISSLEGARTAFKEYKDYLEHRIRAGQININSASGQQNLVIINLARMFAVEPEAIAAGVRRIARSSQATNGTPLPSKIDVGKVLSVCTEIFDGVSDFLLEGFSYPCQLKVNGEQTWMLPGTKWIAPASKLKDRPHWERGFWAWDYETGGVSDVENIYQYFVAETADLQRKAAQTAIKKAEKLLSDANTNHRHQSRLGLATWAHDAFVIMFFANTGMNYSTMQDLGWNPEYAVSMTSQGFRGIKYRAQGKEVEFYISDSFIRRFKKFIKLREYILGGKAFPHLLISTNPVGIFQKIYRGLPQQFSKKVRNAIDSSFPTVTSRQWRASKSDYLLNKTDVATTAVMLQNSEITVMRSYAQGSETQSEKDLGDFYSAVKDKIYEPSEGTKHLSSSVGHCVDQNPIATATDLLIKPDCRQPEGCLFCQKYAIHADRVDVKKLVSLSFVIRETEPLSSSKDHFQKLFGAILAKIDEILDAVSDRSDTLKTMVDQVKVDVFENENLDPYWSAKLDSLVKIGVL